MDPDTSSPISPFLYEMSSGQDNDGGSVSSAKQVCRRPNRVFAGIRNETAVNVMTPVSSAIRSAVTGHTPLQPLTTFSGRLSFGESNSENRQQVEASPIAMVMSPVKGICSSSQTGCSLAKGLLEEKDLDSEHQVKEALSKSELQPNLIGDFTLCHALPLISGQHQDLRTINVQTLAALIRGEFSHLIDQHIVVDCRYPYEFEGGHIVGAINIYTKEGLMQRFFDENSDEENRTSKRKVIIFHCEFSSKRGPKL